MSAKEEEMARATVACPFCGRLNRVAMERLAAQPKCGDCGRPLLLDRPVAVTDESFDRVIAETDVPVVVDFWADWCMPCRFMAPVLDQLARERMGEVLVAKLDVDRNPETAQRFMIRGIPTLMVFRGGREVAREVGVVPRARVEALLEAEQRTMA